MMGLFLFAVLLGFPIAFTLMAMGIGFGYYAGVIGAYNGFRTFGLKKNLFINLNYNYKIYRAK